MSKQFPTIAACDLGTHKTCVLVCEITPQGLEVIGFGESESHGIRKGIIVNIETTVKSLSHALQQAKELSRREIDYGVVGVSGQHLQMISSRGMVPIKDQEVKTSDIHRVIEAASAVQVPLEREVIQFVPEQFIIDGQEGIHEPLGMFGKRLEVSLQLMTAAITPLENIRRCLNKVGLNPDRFFSTSFASARAVFTQAEKDTGVCVVDIGAASSDISVFQEGALRWLRSVPLGGIHLTNDLAVGLKTTLPEAQKLKHQYGCVLETDFETDIEIPGLVGNESRKIEKRMFPTILQPRLDEILILIRNELAKEGVDETLPSGLVLTGGTALLQGIVEAAERIFRLPVRVGRPTGFGGLSDMISRPMYSTVVGLLQLGYEENEELQHYSRLYQKKGLKRFQSQMVQWAKEFF